MSDLNYCPHCGHSLAQYKKHEAPDIFENDDALFYEVVSFVIETKGASASLLQRRFKIGYSRAARMMDFLEENEVVGPADGAKPRTVLFDNIFEFMYSIAVKFVIAEQKASAALLQKEMGISYEVAAKIIDKLELQGIIGPADGSKPRSVLRREE